MNVVARVLESDEYLYFLGGMLLNCVLCWVFWRPRPQRPLSRREIERLRRDAPMPTTGAGHSDVVPPPVVPDPRSPHHTHGAGPADAASGAARPAPDAPSSEVTQ